MRKFSIKDFERLKEAFDNAAIPTEDRVLSIWDRVNDEPVSVYVKDITRELLIELGYGEQE